jgi:hypothetical protein
VEQRKIDALTIASSEFVPDTARFPHRSLSLADVIDPVADIEEVAINQPHPPVLVGRQFRAWKISMIGIPIRASMLAR